MKGEIGRKGWITPQQTLLQLMSYLLVRFEGPVILNSGVTEVLHLPQHGCHEGGPQLLCISADSLPLLVREVLSCPRVEVEGRQSVQEATATVHVPVWAHEELENLLSKVDAS